MEKGPSAERETVSMFAIAFFGAIDHHGKCRAALYTLESIPVHSNVYPSLTLFLLSLPLAQLCFPTMNPHELVDHIRSGPAKLVLDEPLRFRRRTRSNPCDFNEFLLALHSSETIRTVVCGSHEELSIAEDEWVLLAKTIGSISDTQNLTLYVVPGSRDSHTFQAVADAVNNVQSLNQLIVVVHGETVSRHTSGLAALASALQKHPSLQEFCWFDFYSHVQLEAVQDVTLDPVLRSVVMCAIEICLGSKPTRHLVPCCTSILVSF
jgi:hypothetical protein